MLTLLSVSWVLVHLGLAKKPKKRKERQHFWHFSKTTPQNHCTVSKIKTPNKKNFFPRSLLWKQEPGKVFLNGGWGYCLVLCGVGIGATLFFCCVASVCVVLICVVLVVLCVFLSCDAVSFVVLCYML